MCQIWLKTSIVAELIRTGEHVVLATPSSVKLEFTGDIGDYGLLVRVSSAAPGYIYTPVRPDAH